MKREGIHGAGIVSISASGSSIGAANPWWDPNGEGLCVWGAWNATGAADFASSLLDLSGNGNNLTDPGGAATPAWAAGTGWTFDGIGDYLDTVTFIPQNDQSQTPLIQFGNYVGAGTPFGCSSGGPNRHFYVDPAFIGANVLYRNGGNSGAQAPALLAGNLGFAGNQGYRNGVADGGAIGAWGAATPLACLVGANRGGGGPQQFAACNVQAFVLYDCVLTAPQVLAVATAMAAL